MWDLFYGYLTPFSSLLKIETDHDKSISTPRLG